MTALKYQKQILFIFMSLYCVALTSSVAAMEILNFLFFIFGVGSFIIFLAQGKINFKELDLIHYVAVAFFLSVYVSFYFSPSKLDPLDLLVTLRWLFFLFCVAYVLKLTRESQKTYLKIIFIFTGMIALYSIFCFVIGREYTRPDLPMHILELTNRNLYRVRGVYSHVMAYSYAIGIPFVAMVVALFLQPFDRLFQKRILPIIIILTIISMALTFTRGAWFAAGFAVIAASIFLGKKVFIKVFATYVLIFVMSVALFPDLIRRASTGIVGNSDSSITDRVKVWGSHIEMFKDHPLSGMGWHETKKFLPEYNQRLYGERGFVSDAHSNFLAILAGGGVVTFLIWVLLFGLLLFRSWQMWKSPNSSPWQKYVAILGICVGIYFHVGGISQSSFFDKEPLYSFIFICSLLLANLRNENFSGKLP